MAPDLTYKAKYPLNSDDAQGWASSSAVAAVVQRATHGRVSVGALVIVHGARLPRWSVLNVGGVSLVRARRARTLIRSSSPMLGGREVVELGQLLDGAFPRYVND